MQTDKFCLQSDQVSVEIKEKGKAPPLPQGEPRDVVPLERTEGET